QDDFFLDPRCPSFALLSHRVPPVCLTLLSVRRFLEGIPGALPRLSLAGFYPYPVLFPTLFYPYDWGIPSEFG
ncbi:hypothetical protein, partial [Deinococcus xinjiangensis]|uniref:hypothetical protein n=1 Tax=Deinococcus xinjiangensis TaxID=457454 RepID=UPI00336589E5